MPLQSAAEVQVGHPPADASGEKSKVAEKPRMAAVVRMLSMVGTSLASSLRLGGWRTQGFAGAAVRECSMYFSRSRGLSSLVLGVVPLLLACSGDKFSGPESSISAGAAGVAGVGGGAAGGAQGGSAGMASGGSAGAVTAGAPGSGGNWGGSGGCTNGADCATGVCVSGSCVHAANCKKILGASGALADGVYSIDIDADGPMKAMDAQCDFSTQGGGWTLVLNYVHQGGSNPELSALAERLPVLSAEGKLGDDESKKSAHWGHAVPALLAQLQFSETRWQAATSAHPRIVHFRNTSPMLVAYLRTGKGGICSQTSEVFGVTHSFLLPDHSARMPQATTSLALGNCDKGDAALTEFPFFSKAEAHWGIRGESGRWEADDSLAGSSNHTLHRVWVR